MNFISRLTGAANVGPVGVSGGLGVAAPPAVDLSSYSPGNLVTTMIYTLGILSIINLLLGLIPSATADGKSAAAAGAEEEDEVSGPEARSLGLASIVLDALQQFEETYQ